MSPNKALHEQHTIISDDNNKQIIFIFLLTTIDKHTFYKKHSIVFYLLLCKKYRVDYQKMNTNISEKRSC